MFDSGKTLFYSFFYSDSLKMSVNLLTLIKKVDNLDDLFTTK